MVFSSQKATRVGVVKKDNEGHSIVGLSKKLHVPLGLLKLRLKLLKLELLLLGRLVFGILYWRVILWSWSKFCVNLP